MLEVVRICEAFAWLVMRLAVCTVEPNTSRSSATTGPKSQPIRMASGAPPTDTASPWLIATCISRAALSASSARGNVAMISSPMVLMTRPLCSSVAWRITSIQSATVSRAFRSPRASYSSVLPTTSAKRTATELSLDMFPGLMMTAMPELGHIRREHTRCAPDDSTCYVN